MKFPGLLPFSVARFSTDSILDSDDVFKMSDAADGKAWQRPERGVLVQTSKVGQRNSNQGSAYARAPAIPPQHHPLLNVHGKELSKRAEDSFRSTS